MACTYVVRLRTVELEVGLELAVAHLRVNLPDAHGKVASLALEARAEARHHAVDVMLVNLRLDLVVAHGVDLAYLHSRSHALAQDHVQKAEFTVNRSLDGEIGLAVAYHSHIHTHIVQALLHLLDFHTAVEAVLDGALLDQFVLLAREFVVLLRLEVLLACDELFLVKGFLLLVGTAVALHVQREGELVLLHGKLLLLHLYHCVAQDVLLLGEFSFGVEDFQVELVVAQDEYGLTRPDRGTFLHDDPVHHAALLGAELDGGHRLHLAAHAYVVVELPALDRAHGESVRIDPVCPGIVAEHKVEHEGQHEGSEPIW